MAPYKTDRATLHRDLLSITARSIRRPHAVCDQSSISSREILASFSLHTPRSSHTLSLLMYRRDFSLWPADNDDQPHSPDRRVQRARQGLCGCARAPDHAGVAIGFRGGSPSINHPEFDRAVVDFGLTMSEREQSMDARDPILCASCYFHCSESVLRSLRF